MNVKYTISFQELKKGTLRPIDHVSAADHNVDDGESFIVPNVGDYVSIDRVSGGPEATFHGKARSRLFNYVGDQYCHINVVVEENDDDWGKLIKE